MAQSATQAENGLSATLNTVPELYIIVRHELMTNGEDENVPEPFARWFSESFLYDCSTKASNPHKGEGSGGAQRMRCVSEEFKASRTGAIVLTES